MTEADEIEFAARVLGRRFAADFEVVSIGPGPMATLALRGALWHISLDELRTLIDRGLFIEADVTRLTRN